MVCLVEADLGGGLVDGLRCRAWRLARPGPSAHAGTGAGQAHPRQDVVERRAARRPRPAPRAARRAGLTRGRTAWTIGPEEHLEEVGEPLAAGTSGPELVADVATAALGVPGERAPGSERIGRSTGAGACRTGTLVGRPVRSKRVVLLALRGIGQDLVGLVDLLEALLGRLVARLGIGMMLPGELAEGLLDLGLGRGLRHAEDRVVVLVLEVRCSGPPARHRV